jgi:hypothetical protein
MAAAVAMPPMVTLRKRADRSRVPTGAIVRPARWSRPGAVRPHTAAPIWAIRRPCRPAASPRPPPGRRKRRRHQTGSASAQQLRPRLSPPGETAAHRRNSVIPSRDQRRYGLSPLPFPHEPAVIPSSRAAANNQTRPHSVAITADARKASSLE